MTEDFQKISNIVINYVRPLSKKYNLPIEVIHPNDISFMVTMGVPNKKIQQFIENEFKHILKIVNLVNNI